MGPQPQNPARSVDSAVDHAESAGLVVVDVRHESLRAEFFDVGAVVYFLRKVIWTVPGFSVDRYREWLLRLHDRIERNGAFVAHAQRFLIGRDVPPIPHKPAP